MESLSVDPLVRGNSTGDSDADADVRLSSNAEHRHRDYQ
jgi:hypothetical protein